MSDLRIGVIGTGGRARGIVNSCNQVSSIQIVAVCDCEKPRVEGFAATSGKDKNWNVYDDFNQMYDKEKLDGVMVETTPK